MIPLAPAAALLAVLASPLTGPATDPFAAPAPAAPVAPAAFPVAVDAAMIPANARWLAHMDVQKLLNSRIFKILQEHEPELDFANNPDLAEVRQMLGFDPFREVKSVTAYGLPRDEEAAVVMIRTTAVAESALSLLELHLERSAHSLGDVDMWRWSEGRGDDVYTYMARKEGSDARLLLAAPNAHDLATGVSALRGEIDSLADEPGLQVGMGPGTLMYVAASGRLAELGHDEDAKRIAKMVDNVVASLGEQDGALVIDVKVTTANAADAMAAKQMIQGGLAFLGMAARNEPEAQALMPLMNSLQVRLDGSTLHLHLEHDIDELLRLAQELDGGRHADKQVYKVRGEPKKDKPRSHNKDGWY